MFFAKVINKKNASLPGLKFLYLVILIAIFGLVFLNLEVNFRWLKSFSEKLHKQAVEYELTQARRVAGVMESAAQDELEDIENLAYNLSLIGRTTSAANQFIDHFLKENNHTRELMVVNLTGQVESRYSRGATYGSEKTEDYANLEFFEKAKQGEIFITRVNYNDFAEPYVIITLPIVNAGTFEIEAVLLGHYYLRGMWEIALETKIGQTGRISVIDDKGMLVADPRPARVLKKTNLLTIPPTKTIILGEEFTGAKYNNEDGIPVIGVGVPIKIKDQKWGVIIEQNASEIESLLDEVTLWLTVFLVGNLLVIAILIWLGYMIYQSNRELRKKQHYLEEERAKTEEEKNKNAAMVTNFVDPVILVDNYWRLVLFNPAAREVLKLTEQDLGRQIPVKKGRFSLDSLKDIIKVKFTAREIKSGQDEGPQIEEITINAKNKAPENTNPFSQALGSNTGAAVYKVTTTSVCDHNNVCYGYMKIFYDLTREKVIDQLKSEFISIAAHQLRTPLSAIKWVIKMVLDGDTGVLNEDQRALLTKGYQSNERIIKIVNDMLNVSRIEEGRFGYIFAPGNFKELLDGALSGLEMQIKTKKLKIVINQPAAWPLFNFDKEKIAIVLQSLLDNAAEYTPENGTIEITAELGKKDLIFKIKDNGVGIPANDKKNIFTKFFRATNVVRMQTEGSGLSLFIVKNIIEKHGGTIVCVSEEGRGTEFNITLPLNQPDKTKTDGKTEV